MSIRARGLLAGTLVAAIAGCAAASPSQPGASQPATPVDSPAQGAPEFPVAGKPITILVPFAAGGGTDAAVRTLAPILERELGTSIEVVNKPGASTQVAMTELSGARPDGYTIGAAVLPTVTSTYIDPSRQATYDHDSFVGLGTMYANPFVISSLTDGPFSTMQDVVDAAKATSGDGPTFGTAGLNGTNHLVGEQIANATGGQFAYVHFPGSAPLMTAFLGKNVDVIASLIPDIRQHVEAGTVRPLGIAATETSALLPDVPTLQSVGIDVPTWFSAAGGLVAPAGTPQDAVDALSTAIATATSDPAYLSWAKETGYEVPSVTDGASFDDLWLKNEEQIRPFLEAGG